MTDYSESTELAAELALEATDSGEERGGWHTQVALTTLVFAVLAAAAALLAGVSAHEVLLERTEEIVDVAVAQSDLERADTLRVKHELLLAAGVEPDAGEVALVDDLEQQARSELDLAAEARQEAFTFGSAHLVFAGAATVFAVAIAIAGLSVITDKRWLWSAGVILAIGGAGTLVLGIVRLLG